ncbi:MAG: carboxypeptidase-like regulatory domain-containing protein [Bacteroidota bacterium]
MVDNLTKNWQGIKIFALLSFLVLFFPVLSRGDTKLDNNVQSEEKVAATITGQVTSKVDNESLIGVNVLIKGTSTGTVTDFDGNYSIEASESDVLVFSYTGYQDVEVTVGSQTIVNVSMTEGALLDEVVVVGYGTRKKSHNTGAIAQIGGDDVAAIQAARVDDALAGKLPGVLIQNQDGAPGADPKIQIRAASSISGTANPLIVVDGYPISGSLATVNPNDIESLEVLKDAASAAIYGSRGCQRGNFGNH